MPLVVPGIMTNPEDKTQEWANKLVGKTFSENESNETVSVFFFFSPTEFILIVFCHANFLSHMSGERWIKQLANKSCKKTDVLQARLAGDASHHQARPARD